MLYRIYCSDSDVDFGRLRGV